MDKVASPGRGVTANGTGLEQVKKAGVEKRARHYPRRGEKIEEEDTAACSRRGIDGLSRRSPERGLAWVKRVKSMTN